MLGTMSSLLPSTQLQLKARCIFTALWFSGLMDKWKTLRFTTSFPLTHSHYYDHYLHHQHPRYLLVNNLLLGATNNGTVQLQAAAVRYSSPPVAVGLVG